MHEGHHHHHENEQQPINSEALLSYMLEHNKSHAEDLRDLAEKLAAKDDIRASQLVESAADDFDSGNLKLAHALKILSEE